MSDIGDWYKRIPFFTKWWLTLTVVLSLAGRIGLVQPYQMILLYSNVIHKFEIWRLISALFYYPVNPQTGFHFLVNCYFLYNYSLRLETGEFEGRPADYIFMLIINWTCCSLIALTIELPLLMDCMVLSILYVWCQLNKDTIVTFWFGTTFKAMYLPWVFFAFNFIIAGGGISELIGILAGHMYYFLKYTHPQEYGVQSYLRTPSFLYNWFPSRRIAGGFGVPPSRSSATADQSNTGRHNWGRGRVLGGDVD
ncbi:hypothetical protein PGB90_001357 [Kerria lacca]